MEVVLDWDKEGAMGSGEYELSWKWGRSKRIVRVEPGPEPGLIRHPLSSHGARGGRERWCRYIRSGKRVGRADQRREVCENEGVIDITECIPDYSLRRRACL
jgi:hypothetical protein